MPRDEPFVPLTGESTGLSRCERDAFACAFRTNGLDTGINLILPFAKQTLGFGCACICSGKELRLKALPIAPPVFLPYIVRKPFGR